MDNLKDSPHLMVVAVGAVMLLPLTKSKRRVCGEGIVCQGSQPLFHINIFWGAKKKDGYWDPTHADLYLNLRMGSGH